jgi:hypothetical protein
MTEELKITNPIPKHIRTKIHTISLLALTIALIALVSTASTANAGPNGSLQAPVGGEIVEVNILPLLVPYVIIPLIVAAALLSVLIYKHRKRTT